MCSLKYLKGQKLCHSPNTEDLILKERHPFFVSCTEYLSILILFKIMKGVGFGYNYDTLD